MSGITSAARPFFPTSRAAVLAHYALVTVGGVLTAAQVVGVSPMPNMGAAFVLLGLFVFAPQLIKPRGRGLLGPITQSHSGTLSGSVLAVGIVGGGSTITTGQPVWVLIAAGLALIVGVVVTVRWSRRYDQSQ